MAPKIGTPPPHCTVVLEGGSGGHRTYNTTSFHLIPVPNSIQIAGTFFGDLWYHMKLWEPSPCCGNHFLSLGRNQVFLAMFHTYCLLSTWVSICQWLHESGPKWDANSDSLLKTVPEDKLVKIWYPTIYICRCINSSTLRNSTFSGCDSQPVRSPQDHDGKCTCA